MKKWFSVALAAMMVISMTACGSTETPAADAQTTPAEAATF